MEHARGELQSSGPAERVEEIRRRLLALSSHEDEFRQGASCIIGQLKSTAELSRKLKQDVHAKQEMLRNNMDAFTALRPGS